MNLQGLNALVTGASAGLGSEYARQLGDVLHHIEQLGKLDVSRVEPTAHAFAVLDRLGLKEKETTVICLSGRGDKDLTTYMKVLENTEG